ncbi:protein TIFY 6B [Morus notabilis]|nr:protein TIFY 6B [Morus notabilis]
MERDFMGLSSKEPLAVVKEEINNDGFKDSGYTKGSVVQWPFSNKVSALPHFMSFKVGQEDKIRKTTSETHISSGFGPVSTADAFDQSQKRAMFEFQKSFNHDRQGGPHFSLTAYPVQHDMYSVHRPHDVKMFSVPNQAISVSMGNPFLKDQFPSAGQNLAAATTMKQQLLGGIPVTSPHMVLPSACSIAGITEPWNSSKASGSPAQLTIFYAGTVNVYDCISPEKAQAIMFLAGSASSMPSNAANLKAQVLAPSSKLGAADGVPVNQPMNTSNSPLSSPLSVSSHTSPQSGSGSTCTDELMAAKTTGIPTTVSKMEPPKIMNAVGSVPATAMMPSAVPQARKASLARFLEKRKERMMNAAPYNLCNSSSECTAAESNGANFAASPAADSFR